MQVSSELGPRQTDTFLTVGVINNGTYNSTAPPTKSANRTTKPYPSVITFTTPPIPAPATATASPGGNDVSRIINLLFAIL